MQPGVSRHLTIGRFIFMAMAAATLLRGGVEARKSRRPDYCRGQARQQSFLWRVETKPPSYFFGTIHVPYNRVWDHIPENVKRAFHIADAVYFELDLTDASTVSALTRCQQLPRGARLRQILPRDIYRRLQKHLAYVRHMMPLWMTADQRGRGLYADYLFNAITGDWQQKRPIWVMLMVNTLTESDVRSRGVPVLDLYLAQEADKLQKRTGAVERVEEQCLPLNGLNISQVVFALNQTLHQHESIRAGAEAPTYSTDDLIRHYNCGDLDEVIFRRDSAQIPPSVFQVPPLQSAASAAAAAQRLTATSIDSYFREELIYKRNQRMGERILELIWANPNTSYFFAFGAGHFLGNFTVLDVLRQAGYKVTAVGPRERIRRYKRRKRPEDRRRVAITPELRHRARPSQPEVPDLRPSSEESAADVSRFMDGAGPPLPESRPLGGSPQYKQLEVPMELPRPIASPAEDPQLEGPPPPRSGGPVQHWRGRELQLGPVATEQDGSGSAQPGRPSAPPIPSNKYTDNFSDLWVRIDSGKSDAQSSEDRSSLRLQQSSRTPSSSTSASSGVVPTTSAALLTALLLIVLAVSPPRT